MKILSLLSAPAGLYAVRCDPAAAKGYRRLPVIALALVRLALAEGDELEGDAVEALVLLPQDPTPVLALDLEGYVGLGHPRDGVDWCEAVRLRRGREEELLRSAVSPNAPGGPTGDLN